MAWMMIDWSRLMRPPPPSAASADRGHHPEQERSDGEYANHGELSG